MGVEHDQHCVSGVVVRSSKFYGLAALLRVLQLGGSRKFHFARSNVLNHAALDPADVAKNFRGAMAACEIDGSDDELV